MGAIEIPQRRRSKISRQCAGAADPTQHRRAARARHQGGMGRRSLAARLSAAARCHDRGEMGHGRLEHDPEKWEPVFGKDHAQTTSRSVWLFKEKSYAAG